MKKLMHVLVPLLLAVLLVISIGWYLFVYDRDFTRDTLLQQARNNDIRGNSALSAWFYNLAYNFSGQDENVAIELANQYKSAGNYTKAEVTLSKAIAAGATKELYMALSKTYVEQDKLLDAESLMSNISNPTIASELEALRPSAPTADYESGYYSQYISVTLSSSEGTLYYTTDGDYPSVADAPYSSPIELPAGETRIYAISVADNGLVSPVTVLGYTIGGVIEPVIFMDATMESTVRDILKCEPSHILYTNDLWQIKELTVPEGVTTLEDLKYMTYLESLTMNGRNMSNLNDLSELNHLKKLDLTGCRFSTDSLSVIASLPALQELVLSDCGLSTLSGLEKAQNLTSLNLNSNTVRNLEPLKNLTRLQELVLSHNAITDLTVLGGLPNLVKLDVSHNTISTLNPINTCSKLNSLNAANNQLTDASAAASLPILAELLLDYNQISDVSGLSGCSNLTTLTLSNNNISDISPLKDLFNLETLDFSYNKVSEIPAFSGKSALQLIDGSYNAVESIDTLADLPAIRYIYMDYNKITNVDALADCALLVQLNVYGNEIASVSALTEHDIIVNYDPTNSED